MNQQNRHEEPSMDEILASIRKIISEDVTQPGAPNGLAVPRSAEVLAASPVPSKTPAGVTNPAAAEAPASLSAKLNGAFGYVPASDAARAPAAAPWPRTPNKAAIDDDMADILAGEPEPRTVKAVLPTLSALDGLRNGDRPLSQPAAPAANVPAARAAPISTPEPAPNAGAAVLNAASPAGPVVIAAAPRLRPSIEATLPPKPAAVAPAPALEAVPEAAASPARVVVAAMPPVAKEAATAAILPTPAPEPAPERPDAMSPAPNAADDVSAAAVASALGSLAAGLAASSRAPAPEIVVSAEEVVAAPGAASGPAEQAQSPAAAPMVGGAHDAPQGRSVFTAPEAFIGGVALTPVKTIDDTAAELLRPMLRQWLDSNMPRIVEKALRIELTQPPVLLAKPDDKA